MTDGNSLRRSRTFESVLPVVGVTLYGLPGFVVALGLHSQRTFRLVFGESVLRLVPEPAPLFLLFLLSVVGGCTLFFVSLSPASRPRRQRDAGGEARAGPTTVAPRRPDAASALLAKYESVGREARYRDKLIIRTNYFSLALLGLFGTIYIRMPLELRPALAVAGTAIAFVFTLAVKKYSGARNELRELQREIESGSVVGRGVRPARRLQTRERDRFERVSLAEVVVLFHVLLVLFMVGLYVWNLGVATLGQGPLLDPVR